MVKYDVQRARQAVQLLVDTSYFSHHLRKLNSTLPKPRALPFRAELEVLNELLVIGRQSKEAFDNLIALAQFKRDDRNTYQRDYMAAKRQRDRKVIKLEESMVGRKLTLDERRHLLLKQYEVWNKERDVFLKTIADRPWAERNAALKDFWKRKEDEIDLLQNEADRHGPVKRHRVYKVEAPKKPPKPTVMREALKKALDTRR